jgi:hypothetical protein
MTLFTPCRSGSCNLKHQKDGRESSFRSLPLRKQIEYTAFRYLDTHPPDIKWRIILTDNPADSPRHRAGSEDAEEPSDQFVVGPCPS